MKRKIDIIVKYFYPVVAGIETNILETYSVLASQGWDITVHTSNIDYTTGKLLKSKDSVRGLKVRRYPLSIFGFSPQIFYENCDLVCLHNFNIFPHFWMLVKSLSHKITGKKNYSIVLTPHGGFNPEWRVFSKIAAVIKALYHYTIGVFLINRVVDSIRAVSEWERNEMIKKGIRPSKIVTIPNGIENEAYEDLERKASDEIKQKVRNLGRYIIQIGRIYPIKNYETTIKALPYLQSDIKYVIVGPKASQRYYDYLQRLAKDLGVDKRIIYFGVVRGIDKYYLIKNSQVMVHMAIWESFCNVVHEGLSQGLICIVANNTALPFLIKDSINGYCIDTFHSKELAKKINYVLENKDSLALKRMSAKNRKLVLEESWTKVAAKMANLYSQN